MVKQKVFKKIILFTDITQVLLIDLSLPYLNNKIATSLEFGPYTSIFLIDLQKGFHTVNFNISIKKMEFIGFFEETTK